MISDGHVVERARRKPGLRSSDLDHAVRLQNGDDVTEVDHGSLEPGGQLVLTLKSAEQGVTKADVAQLTDRLRRIESLLSPAH